MFVVCVLQALQQQLQQQQQSIQQTLQQLVMFGQTAGSGTSAQLPPQAQFYLQNQVRFFSLLNSHSLLLFSSLHINQYSKYSKVSLQGFA